MAVVARILGYALFTAGLGIFVAYVLNCFLGNSRDFVVAALLFGCIGESLVPSQGPRGRSWRRKVVKQDRRR